MKKSVCFSGIMFLALMATIANASLTQGMPGGDFSDPYFAGGSLVQNFPGQGGWTYYQSVNATTTVVGSGADRHAELWTEWFVRGSSFWYTAAEATSATESWKISADLKTDVYNSAAHKYFVATHDTTRNVWDFFLDFNGNVQNGLYPIQWTAGAKSGTYYASTSILNSYATVSMEYDPITGAAIGKIGNETIFNEIIATGMKAQTVYFGKIQSAYGDQGIFSVDNVTAIPEPVSAVILALGSLLTLRKRK